MGDIHTYTREPRTHGMISELLPRVLKYQSANGLSEYHSLENI